jgi:FixJ family two-component response regulator
MKSSVSVTPLIAVVDDDESVCEAIKELLAAAGFDSEAYSSAEEFLHSGQLHLTACLVTDVVMAGMSGFDLAQKLVALGYKVPVIMVSGCPNEKNRAVALSLGAVCFLPKPVAKGELVASIKIALNRDHGSQGVHDE